MQRVSEEGRKAGDGVVLSMADKVVLGNREGLQARMVCGERWEGRGPD
jgi:hypothetical protein